MTSDSRTPEQIEREIERERAGLTDTLDDLQNKFSVETIARQFSDQFREHGGDIGRSVSDAVKRNPVALAMTGVGIAWLMLGDKASGSDRNDRDRRYGRFPHDDRYGDDRYANDRRDRTEPPDRDRPRMPDTRNQQYGSQLDGSSAHPRSYYSRQHAGPRDLPSWARTDDHDSGQGMDTKIRDAASGAGESVAGAASSAVDSARDAGSAIADKASGAVGAVSDAGRSAADSSHDLAAAASDSVAAYRERLAEGTENLAEEARKRVIAARESAIEARDAAMSYARQGRDRAVDIFEEQPLISGALAVAVGAAFGAALPRSRMEDEYLGDSSDHLMEEAERIFAEEKAKLGKVAKAATDEAKNIVQEAKADAESVAKAAVEKAKASGERITDAAESEAKKQNLGDVKQS